MYDKFMRHEQGPEKLKLRYELHHSAKSPARRAKRRKKKRETFYNKARSRLDLLTGNKNFLSEQICSEPD